MPLSEERIPLGIKKGIFFSTDTINFAAGDKIFFYTNGITDALDENNDSFGKSRLSDALNKNISASVTETIKNLDAEIKNFVGNAEQLDDITMIALEYFGAGNEEANS